MNGNSEPKPLVLRVKEGFCPTALKKISKMAFVCIVSVYYYGTKSTFPNGELLR